MNNITESVIRHGVSKIPVEDRKLVTPGELRAFAQRLRGVSMDFAAIELESMIAQVVAEAEAADAERQAELERRKAEQAERDERARAHAEAYRNRPILGLREGDVLINFGNHSASRWAGPPTDHIGFLSEDGSYYRARCGADVNATYSARKTGAHAREIDCKRCIAIAKKEGLL